MMRSRPSSFAQAASSTAEMVALKLLLCGDEDQATGIAERLAEGLSLLQDTMRPGLHALL